MANQLTQLFNRISQKVSSLGTKNDKPDKFQALSDLLREYPVDIYFKDRLGILTRRQYGDNFKFIFETKQSCDAFPMMLALDKKLNNLDTVFDVGACIGITAIWLAKKAKRVYAFEPAPPNMERLLDNVAVNHADNIIPRQLAVSNKVGSGNLHIMSGYGHHSLGPVKTSEFVKNIRIKTTTLDAFCKKEKIKKIDVLKVDVEGFEAELFEGAAGLLKAKRIRFIIFEISKVPLESLGKNPNDVVQVLTDSGYRVRTLQGKPVTAKYLQSIHHEDLIAEPK